MPSRHSLPTKSPSVALGEAHEALQRALLFGTATDVENAEARIEKARALQADIDRIEHGSLIDEILGRLPAPRRGDVENPTVTMLEKAAAGEILYSELVRAWQSDPDSFGFPDRVRAFVEVDPRRLRALISAHREEIPFEEVETAVARVEDSHQNQYALAARSDGVFDPASLSEWLTSYAAELSPTDKQRR
ncbi:hypothetical protein DBV08_18880 [Rhodococcus sp. KBW08]|nr:hypothetical protein DBV08_18880 [Rhodococcus sp. KBW08]